MIYILEGVSVQTDSITSEGKLEKYMNIIRGHKDNYIKGYTKAISQMYGELHFTEEISIMEKIMIIA